MHEVTAPTASGSEEAHLSELDVYHWAGEQAEGNGESIRVSLGPRTYSVANSSATGEPLVSNGLIGADIIRLAAGTAFAPHTHEGDHLLIVVGGEGTITYRGKVHPTCAGDIYMVEGSTPHAVGAITDHVIIAVGAPHAPIDSPRRMSLVAYETVTTDIHDLHCLICDIHAMFPTRLHHEGCGHCPCDECHPAPAHAAPPEARADEPSEDRP